MTDDELKQKLNSLENMADSLRGAAKFSVKAEIAEIRAEMKTWNLRDIAEKMDQITPTDTKVIDKGIAAAKDAMVQQDKLKQHIESALGAIKTAVKFAA